MNIYKSLALGLMLLFFGWHARAEDHLLNSLSPGLRTFLKQHPEDYKILTNAFAEAFTNQTVRIFYFYSDDPTLPGAEHCCPDDWEVYISIKVNLPPTDEYICLLFEVLNSENDQRFADLGEKARAGRISKHDFATEIMRQEFNATIRLRDLLGKLQFTKREKVASKLYKEFLATPDNFEEFLECVKNEGSKRDWRRDYESKYDHIRGLDP